ncbi:hypothetical protein [Streptomyces sp. NBC_00996]|uniref:hypothetical protein n=1 Tax=Streptomyces sp. NBC_00996 TaxID=2903710 RepID=UPI0038654170|nr:hypothetical protein OG390_09140 [Streptomyces sp. NBC_00996]
MSPAGPGGQPVVDLSVAGSPATAVPSAGATSSWGAAQAGPAAPAGVTPAGTIPQARTSAPTRTTAAQTRTAARPTPQAAAPQASVQAAPRTPTRATSPRPSPSRTSSARRPASVPSAEPAWGETKRPKAARGKSRDDVGWVKAHGGAGVTSLVETLGGVDVGARWPEPARGEPRRIVLVGRTSARGLRSVSQALGALEEGNAPQGLDLLGVVLVADAPGRLPLSLLRRIRVLRSVARVHRVPWIPAWRTGGRPKSTPRQLATLAKLVGSEHYSEGAAS